VYGAVFGAGVGEKMYNKVDISANCFKGNRSLVNLCTFSYTVSPYCMFT